MAATTNSLTTQQQRLLKFVFKFRFVTAHSLAQVIGHRREWAYQVLESLVSRGLLVKVYEPSFRIDRKPAIYYLSKPGVTELRKILDAEESYVNPLYKNDQASAEFVSICLDTIATYPIFKLRLPDGTDIFTKIEMSRQVEFPRNRPDLHIRTPQNQEAIVVFVHRFARYITNKRFDEIVTHSEDEGWVDGKYPRIAFVLRDQGTKRRFLYRVARKFDDMGMDEDDLQVIAATIDDVRSGEDKIWASVYAPRTPISLMD